VALACRSCAPVCLTVLLWSQQASGRHCQRNVPQLTSDGRIIMIDYYLCVFASGSWLYERAGASGAALFGILLIRKYAASPSPSAPTTPSTIAAALVVPEPAGAAVGDAVVPLRVGAAVAADGAEVLAVPFVGAAVVGAAVVGAAVVGAAVFGAGVVGAAVGAAVAVLMTLLMISAAREASAITVATG
jgi:hypothetical protein